MTTWNYGIRIFGKNDGDDMDEAGVADWLQGWLSTLPGVKSIRVKVEADSDREPTLEDQPTEWAYEKACEAREKHRARADEAEAKLAAIREDVGPDRDGWYEVHRSHIHALLEGREP